MEHRIPYAPEESPGMGWKIGFHMHSGRSSGVLDMRKNGKMISPWLRWNITFHMLREKAEV